MNHEKTIQILRENGCKNVCKIEDGKLIIEGSLDLCSLKSCDKDFLKDTTINGYLYLDSLQTCDKDFLKDTVINGSIDLSSLQTFDKDFLKDTVINGVLIYVPSKIRKAKNTYRKDNPRHYRT